MSECDNVRYGDEGYMRGLVRVYEKVYVVPVASRPEFHVPLANSGDTNFDNNDMITPSNAFKNTNIITEPHTYWVGLTFHVNKKIIHEHIICHWHVICYYTVNWIL